MNRYERRSLKKEIHIFEDLVNIIKQYLPGLINKFDKLTDIRHQSYITYRMSVIMMVRLVALMCGLKSMREQSSVFNTEETIDNIAKMLNVDLTELPHYDTVNDVLENVKIEEIREIQKYIVNHLIRTKMFDKYRYKGKYFQVVIDGTGLVSFHEKHCNYCLKKVFEQEDGSEKILYYHYVLEAKLIVGDIVISIDTEFVENEKEDVDKQDCELNAFKRMEKRIKTNYPKLPIVITGDALYACEPVMDICIKNRWEYILRFKNERIPTLGDDFEKMIVKWNESTKDNYGFVNSIGWKTKEVNVYRYIEKTDKRETQFTWITSFKVTNNNIEILTGLGRKRWMIENEGFNMQKNGTFDIQHIYSRNYNAMKANYFLIQFAHTIRQLLEKGLKIVLEIKMSIKEVSAALTLALTHTKLNLTELKKTQLRFNTE